MRALVRRCFSNMRASGRTASWEAKSRLTCSPGISLEAADQVVTKAAKSPTPFTVLLDPGAALDAEKLAFNALLQGPMAALSVGVRGTGGAFASMLQRDATLKRLAVRAATSATGVGSEAALLTAWGSLQQNGTLTAGATFDDFLANLVTSAMNRGIQQAGGSGSRMRAFARRVCQDRRLSQAMAETTAHQSAALADRQREAGELVNFLARGQDLGSPQVAARVHNALITGSLHRLDLNMVWAADQQRYGPLLQGINDQRRVMLQESIPAALEVAWSDLITDHLRVRDAVEAELATATTAQQRATIRSSLAAADARYDYEVGLLQKVPQTPGSSKPASDVDRSSPSTYLRDAFKKVFDEKFSKDADIPLRPGEAPTTASALDANEYSDLFPHIDQLLPRRDLDGAFVPLRNSDGLTVPDPRLTFTHADAVEAGSLATILMTLSPAERRVFERNRLQDAEPADKTTLANQFFYAKQTLGNGRRELQAELTRLQREDGRDPNAADTILRARDNLYGRRTREIQELWYRLQQMPDRNSTAGRQMAARIVRMWNFANREGIEAYSDLVSINAIVQNIQIQGRSVRDAINDDSFNAAALGYTRQAMNGMINDHMAMDMHHVHGFRNGHEGVIDAADALAKYAERGVLAGKLHGDNIENAQTRDIVSAILAAQKREKDGGAPVTDAEFAGLLARIDDNPTSTSYGALNQMAGVMMTVRGQPRMRAVLERYGNGDADAGLRELFQRLERTLPGAQGILTGTAARDTGGAVRPTQTARNDAAFVEAMRRFRTALALQRERDMERGESMNAGTGSGKPVDELGATRAAQAAYVKLLNELDELRARQTREKRVAATYLPAHWLRAQRTEAELVSNQRQLSALARCLCGLRYKGRNGQWTRNRCKTSVQTRLESRIANGNSDLRIMAASYTQAGGRSRALPDHSARIKTVEAQAALAKRQLARRLTALQPLDLSGGPGTPLPRTLTSRTPTGQTETPTAETEKPNDPDAPVTPPLPKKRALPNPAGPPAR